MDRQTKMRVYSNSFVSDGTWVAEETRYQCWHCCRWFEGIPVPVPTNYIEAKRKYHVTGTFCTFSCAKSYMVSNVGYCTPLTMSWLTQMAKEYFGYRGLTIECAPDREWIMGPNPKITFEEFDAIVGSREPCETLRKSLIPACVLESSSLLMVHGKPSVTMRDVLATRNNETEVEEAEAMDKDQSDSQSMYGKFLSQKGSSIPSSAATAAPATLKKKARKKQRRETEESTAVPKKSGRGSLANFIKK